MTRQKTLILFLFSRTFSQKRAAVERDYAQVRNGCLTASTSSLHSYLCCLQILFFMVKSSKAPHDSAGRGSLVSVWSENSAGHTASSDPLVRFLLALLFLPSSFLKTSIECLKNPFGPLWRRSGFAAVWGMSTTFVKRRGTSVVWLSVCLPMCVWSWAALTETHHIIHGVSF